MEEVFFKERPLPKKIREDIIRTNIGDSGKHKRDPHKVYVTSTTFECPRKVVLEYFLNEKGYTTFPPDFWITYRGNLFDERWSNLYQDNQGEVSVIIPLEDEDDVVLIRGRYDAVDADEGVLIDFKTSNDKNKDKLPKKEHIMQVSFYHYIWNNTFGEGEKLRAPALIYAMMETSKMFEIDVGEDYENVKLYLLQMIKRAKKIAKAQLKRELPKAKPGTHCNFCVFKGYCEHWEEGKKVDEINWDKVISDLLLMEKIYPIPEDVEEYIQRELGEEDSDEF